jgi:hypothetical protein
MKAWHKCSWIRNQESTEQESAVASQFTSSSVDFLEFGVDLQRCPLGCDIGKGRPFSLLSELRSIPMLTIRVWRGGFGTHIFGFVHVAMAIGGRAFGCREDTSGTKLSKCSVCFVSSVYSRRQESELSFYYENRDYDLLYTLSSYKSYVISYNYIYKYEWSK